MRFKKNRTRRKLNKTKQKSKRNNGGGRINTGAMRTIGNFGKEIGKSIFIDNVDKIPGERRKAPPFQYRGPPTRPNFQINIQPT